MMICKQCDAENPDEGANCMSCGRRLTSQDYFVQAPPESMRRRRLLENADPAITSAGQTPASVSRVTDSDRTQPSSREYATFAQRFGARLIDGVILFVASIVIELIIPSAGLARLVDLAWGAGYYIVFWSRGASPGMRTIGIRMIREETGEPPSAGRALGRYVVSIISTIALFLGFLWMLWDHKHQTWHDKAVGTVVIQG